MDPITTTLRDAQSAHRWLVELWPRIKPWLLAGHRLHVTIRPATRSLEQNSLFWSVLTDLSKQVEWPVDGKTQKLSPEEWKDILTAGLTKHQRVAQGIEGGWVMLGERTSRMSVATMADLITFAHAFGDQHSVQWAPTSLGRDWAMLQEPAKAKPKTTTDAETGEILENA